VTAAVPAMKSRRRTYGWVGKGTPFVLS
jgi:hypothetical protein